MSEDLSKVAKGTEYEIFVQGVYQALIAAEGVETVEVKHNTLLAGRSGCEHQIDVYWEFKVAGQLYRTAVECKAFDKSVGVGRVRDFYGVLADVPGVKGVFATLVGYQSGARKYGEHYGISLMELREPTEADWNGRVRDINVRIHVVMPEIRGFSPRFTPALLARISAAPPAQDQTLQTGVMNNTPIVFSPAGEPVASYEDLRLGLPTDGDAATGLTHFEPFPQHTLRLGGIDQEIEGIDFKYDVLVETSELHLSGDAIAKAIVKDATSGEVAFVDTKDQVRKPGTSR